MYTWKLVSNTHTHTHTHTHTRTHTHTLTGGGGAKSRIILNRYKTLGVTVAITTLSFSQNFNAFATNLAI